eukprot:scaffold116512_cov87-Phaeocystis_antarctica.AAC.7
MIDEQHRVGQIVSDKHDGLGCTKSIAVLHSVVHALKVELHERRKHRPAERPAAALLALSDGEHSRPSFAHGLARTSARKAQAPRPHQLFCSECMRTAHAQAGLSQHAHSGRGAQDTGGARAFTHLFLTMPTQ